MTPPRPSNAAELIAGRYELRPGDARALRGGRPLVAPALLRRVAGGRPAGELADRLGPLFAVCGHAHRSGWRRAAAMAWPEGATRADIGPDADSAAQADAPARWREALQDHGRQLALTLPTLAGADPQGQAGASRWWAGRPALPRATGPTPPERASGRRPPAPAGEDERARLADWLAASLLGEPVAGWWARWQAEGEAMLRDWAGARAAHPVAAALRSLEAPARGLCLADPWLDPLLDAAPLHALLRPLVDDEARAARPTWQGRCALVTPLWRPRPAPRPRGRADNAWMLIAARLPELVRLAHEGPAALPGGALRPAPREGLAWTLMGRGLLLHWLRVDGEGRVEDLRVLAPTEWNFHPEGALARALAALPDPRGADAASAAATRRAARLLAAAADACVDVRLADDAPAPHPENDACTR